MSCDDGNPCNGVESCSVDQCVAGSAVADGTTCGAARSCRAGSCVADACGDGVVQAGEDCDDRNTADGDSCPATCQYACGNAQLEPGEECDGGVGCTADCKFECTDSPATQCADVALPVCRTYACGADHQCVTVVDPGQEGTACDPSHPDLRCEAGFCRLCGNGVLEPPETCDDGNVGNLDGCDSGCRLEQAARLTALEQQFAGDAFCPENALGAAITADAQPTIQATWDAPILDGTLSIVFKFLGLSDVLGPDTSASFELGFVNAAPVAPPDGVSYDGTSDLDWWYVREPASVDASEVPVVRLPGVIDRGHITAGPGQIKLKLLFALSPAEVTLYHAKVDARIDGPVGAPLVSTGAPPGHLASEHVAPGVRTFTTASVGAMCSDVSVQSLFDTPVPGLLQSVCTDAGGENPVFTLETNKLLDVFVFGCAVFGLPGIVPTQPDGSLDGATYQFGVDPVTHTVATCTRDGAPAELADCVAQATYSSSFRFKSDRVIIHRE